VTDLSTIDFAAAAAIIKRLAEVAEALILSHADAVGLTCTAVEVAPPVYHAAKARFAKPAEHRRSATKPKTHRKAADRNSPRVVCRVAQNLLERCN
jgi:hypothetical protein